MSEEWGPWIEHSGKGCPLPNGTFVNAIYCDGTEIYGMVEANGRPLRYNAWVWSEWGGNVIRYRIRKPKGLQILEALLQELPESVDA